ncbi:subclass B3 metallo-beta-lactamase [Dyella sp. BiH032]|uniref:subclass B3 metallo-beta-lactamase n=1 Tax=Dyella sp. BiH032 TaxID=3075430 RepID=UPI0028935F60|nr:subclass B3 metallo-beta-lactamase [Dyella sp. BiH032]WNL48146.1 subclass B3 metallo-beta-lactamase [Dyella sp. BiH032]
MHATLRLLLAGAAALVFTQVHAVDDRGWAKPEKPFRLYGDTWYVGTHGLSAVLITSPQGHVLIDGTLPENAPQIEANIKALGFRLGDVKAILNSHAHFDHAGAIAALAKASGAKVYASQSSAEEMMAGGDYAEDPQNGEAPHYPKVAKVEVVQDGGKVKVGDIEVTAHYTPWHTPGATSWTWRSCEKERCIDVVYADSITAFTNGVYRYGDPAHPERVAAFRKTFGIVAALPCDLLLTTHPDVSGFFDKVSAHRAGATPDPLFDPDACKTFAKTSAANFEDKLKKEASEAKR